MIDKERIKFLEGSIISLIDEMIDNLRFQEEGHCHGDSVGCDHKNCDDCFEKYLEKKRNQFLEEYMGEINE